MNTGDSQVALHLRVLVHRLTEVLSNLFRWKVDKMSCEMGARAQPIDDMFQNESILVPIAAEFGEMPAPNPQAAASLGDLAIVPHVPNYDVLSHKCLQAVQEQMTRADNAWVPLLNLENVHAETVGALVTAGNLELHEDEFGDTLVRIVESGLMHVLTRTIGTPEQVTMIDETDFGSKLDLMLGLKRYGWTQTDEIPEPYTLDGDSIFLGRFSRPLSYFLCLSQVGDLIEKGVPKVCHDQNDIYYQCLLRMKGDHLIAFLQHVEQGIDEKWCRMQLKALPPEPGIEICPIEQGDIGPDEDGDDPNFLVGPLLPLVLDHSLEWKRCIAIHDDGRRVKLYVDHLTGGTVRQRSYSNCIGGCHHNCFLWQMCDHYASRNELALFMFAWASDFAPYANRLEHMAARPTQAQIEALRPHVKFVEW